MIDMATLLSETKEQRHTRWARENAVHKAQMAERRRRKPWETLLWVEGAILVVLVAANLVMWFPVATGGNTGLYMIAFSFLLIMLLNR